MTLHGVISDLVQRLEVIADDVDGTRIKHCDGIFIDVIEQCISRINCGPVKAWLSSDSFAAFKLSELKTNLERFKHLYINGPVNEQEFTSFEKGCRECYLWLDLHFSPDHQGIGERLGLENNPLLLFNTLLKKGWVSFEEIFEEKIVDSSDHDAINKLITRVNKKLTIDGGHELKKASKHGIKGVELQFNLFGQN